MGIEVGFRDIKEVGPSSADIGTFSVGLVQYMKELAKEDEQHMI